MGIFILLTGMGTILFGVFLGFLIWSIRADQYGALDIEGERALWDDLGPPKP